MSTHTPINLICFGLKALVSCYILIWSDAVYHSSFNLPFPVSCGNGVDSEMFMQFLKKKKYIYTIHESLLCNESGWIRLAGAIVELKWITAFVHHSIKSLLYFIIPYTILSIKNIHAPPSQNHPVAPLPLSLANNDFLLLTCSQALQSLLLDAQGVVFGNYPPWEKKYTYIE